MRLFSTVAGLRCYLNLQRSPESALAPNQSTPETAVHLSSGIGLVPTMGALHAGHLSLIRQARQANRVVVVSIFVNPLQFGPHEDFQQYPRTLSHDQELCEQAGVDVLFAPAIAELYPDSQRPTQVVPPEEMTSVLCGRVRPGHFQGVATVVTKLLNLVQPDRAYFGQKDAQQLAIIRRLVQDLNLPVEIVGCPIVREQSGLALSSRNQYLSPAEKQQASILYQGLQRSEKAFWSGARDRLTLTTAVELELSTVPEITPEYIELVHPMTMAPLEKVDELGLLAVAARVGSTRLIDNIVLQVRRPIVAIDGPAGAGKSTVARQVAQALGLLYLDTGAMYRAVTWLVLQSGIAVQDQSSVAELVSQCQVDFQYTDADGLPLSVPQVFINEQNVTQEIRTLEVTSQVSAIAAQASVRQALVKQQQRLGHQGGIVMEGRDIGTQVFPNAELKIFLTASVQERARRRLLELNNHEISLEQLEQAIYERDQKDSTRVLSPLRKAEDAIEIQTDGMTIQEVIDRIVSLYETVCASLATA